MPQQFGGVYRVAITPADVGARITLRRTLPEGVGDVVGELLSWTAGTLTIRTRRRGDVEVAESTLLAARRIP